MKCPRCGANIPSGAKSCGSCGVQLAAGQYCPHCGKVIPKGSQKCPKCGRAIPQQAGSQPAGARKPLTKRWWFWAVCTLLVVGILGNLGNALSDRKSRSQGAGRATPPPATTAAPSPTPAAEPTASPSPTPEPAPTNITSLPSGSYTLPCGMKIDFSNTVKNDVTGKWRISSTSSNLAPADYALEYYNLLFSSDDEIHGVWNSALGTTTRIIVQGNLLLADTLEYVDSEETDANLLFSGTLLDSKIVELTSEVEPDAVQTPIPQSSAISSNNFNTHDNPDQQQTNASYVLNTSTMKFHYPNCKDVKKIAPDNYATFDGTSDEAQAKGYSSCGHCNP